MVISVRGDLILTCPINCLNCINVEVGKHIWATVFDFECVKPQARVEVFSFKAPQIAHKFPFPPFHLSFTHTHTHTYTHIYKLSQ